MLKRPMRASAVMPTLPDSPLVEEVGGQMDADENDLEAADEYPGKRTKLPLTRP